MGGGSGAAPTLSEQTQWGGWERHLSLEGTKKKMMQQGFCLHHEVPAAAVKINQSETMCWMERCVCGNYPSWKDVWGFWSNQDSQPSDYQIKVIRLSWFMLQLSLLGFDNIPALCRGFFRNTLVKIWKTFSILFLVLWISQPLVPQGVRCQPRCLNLGVRTHRASAVYSRASPVKNTLLWKFSHSARSKNTTKLGLTAKQAQVYYWSCNPGMISLVFWANKWLKNTQTKLCF